MKMFGFFVVLLFFCSCAHQGYKGPVSTAHDTERTVAYEECTPLNVQPVKSKKLYENYYGTILTRDTSWLRTPGGSYRWGIANSKPLSLAHFGAYVKPAGKYGRFRAKVYIDRGVNADMVFTFRAESYNGEVLKNLIVQPGTTKRVDIDIEGVKKLYIGAELRINHDTAKKIIIGDPEFYSCRQR